MRFVIFLGDGMADYPVPELGNRTPLEAAKKPAMDEIARRGRCGQFITVENDMPPGSEVANLTVLGYDPHRCHQGRGVIEAAAMGVELKESDIAMRCNLICIEDGRIKNHSAGHISTEEAKPLIEAMNAVARDITEIRPGISDCVPSRQSPDHLTTRPLDHSPFRFFPGISYRHLLVLGSGSTDFECAPPHDHAGEPFRNLMVKPLSDAAKPTAELLNRLILTSQEILPAHPVNQARVRAGKDPANSIWVWSQGRKPKMKTYKELFGISGAVISAVDLVRGLGVYAGLDVIDVPGATGLIDTNYEGKADACLDALADHDFVYVHVEAADEAGHSRDLELKMRAIEYFDSRLVARVMKGLEERRIETRVAVLPDHATPVSKGNHVHGPVPVAIAGPGIEPDRVQAYDEVSVRPGMLGMLRGDQFIRTLLVR